MKKKYLVILFNILINNMKKYLKNKIYLYKEYLNRKIHSDSEMNFYEHEVKSVYKKQLKHEKIINNLKSNGFYIIDNFLDGKLVKKLKIEFDLMLKLKKNHFDVEKTKTIQIRNYDKSFYLKNKLYLIYFLFSNKNLKELLERLFGKKLILNSEIFFQRTLGTTVPLAGKFHFDKERSIKLWFYINDCGEDNGPLECIKGSHIDNKILRDNLKSMKSKTNDYNLVSNKSNIGTKLIAKSGSLVIFDSDLSHKATPVKSGHFREIIRGATFS